MPEILSVWVVRLDEEGNKYLSPAQVDDLEVIVSVLLERSRGTRITWKDFKRELELGEDTKALISGVDRTGKIPKRLQRKYPELATLARKNRHAK